MKNKEKSFIERAKGLRSFDSNTSLGAQSSKPATVFAGAFSLQFLQYYANQTVPALVTPANVPAAGQTSIPVFAFGKMDFDGGYSKALSLIPNTSGWTLELFGIFNVNIFPADIDVNIRGLLRTGDMVFRYGLTTGGVDYERVVVVRCPQVSYGTLLSALSSDSFTINAIQYTVNALTLNQLNNQITLVNQSIFGKSENDQIDPTLYITGDTFNRNISGIPLSTVITKQKGFAFLANFDANEFTWSVTCSYITKTR